MAPARCHGLREAGKIRFGCYDRIGLAQERPGNLTPSRVGMSIGRNLRERLQGSGCESRGQGDAQVCGLVQERKTVGGISAIP